jgi:hypothetical protein
VITIAMMAHEARRGMVDQLSRSLGGRIETFIDDGGLGEISNAARAWDWAVNHGDPNGWILVLQDDALPIELLRARLDEGLTTLPQPGLVSLYLGTGYPRIWQNRVARVTAEAALNGASWIRSAHLLHGVGVAAPADWAPDIVETLQSVSSLSRYDEVLSRLARQRGWPVFYTYPSMVDHADTDTLLSRPRVHPRRAWRVGVPVWDSTVVELKG